MQVAREFTHERTKQRIAHLNTIAVASAVKAQLVTPQRLPRGRGTTRQVDQFFMQQQLKELNLDEPAFEHCPTLLSTRPGTPEHEQFDSAHEDRAMPQVHWTPSLMPAWARRWIPQGARLVRTQLKGANEGIAP